MNEKELIRQFVVDNFLVGDDSEELDNDGSLLDLGIIDSTGVLELVSFVEEQFEFEVEDQDVVPENFDTVNCIVAYVQRKVEDSNAA